MKGNYGYVLKGILTIQFVYLNWAKWSDTRRMKALITFIITSRLIFSVKGYQYPFLLQPLFQLAKQALESVKSAVVVKEKLPMVRRVKIYDVFNVKPVAKCDLILNVTSEWPSLGKTILRRYVIGSPSHCQIMLSVVNLG